MGSTDLRVQVARRRFSKPLQILVELLPRWQSCSGLPELREGQKATVDFVSTVLDQRETLLLRGPLGRSAAMRLPETRGLDKTIRAARHSTAYLGLLLPSPNR